MTMYFCGISEHDTVRRNIFGDYTAGTHNRVFADGNVGQDGAPGADRRTFFYESVFDFPVGFGLQGAVIRRRPWKGVIDKSHIVTDKNIVFDDDSFTDERMARNLAPASHGRIFLDLDERTDLGFIADFATIQIDELESFTPRPNFTPGPNR